MKILPLTGPFHFIGIGGAGMSPLAEILRAQGQSVSGSDEKGSAATARLSAMGVLVHEGHDARHVAGAQCVVVSSAIKDSNPELAEGRARGLRVIHRGDLLDAVMAPFAQRVAISGSHGKTTTTAMVTGILEAAGFDPTALVGGKLKGSQSGARIGHGRRVRGRGGRVRSVLPQAASDGLARDQCRSRASRHLRGHGGRDAAAFTTFALGVPAHGTAVLCADDPVAAGIAKSAARSISHLRVQRESRMCGARVSMQEGGFPRVAGAGPRGSFEFTLGVGGDMNALNALGAMAVAQRLGIAPALASRSLASFRGVARRLEWKGRTRRRRRLGRLRPSPDGNRRDPQGAPGTERGPTPGDAVPAASDHENAFAVERIHGRLLA